MALGTSAAARDRGRAGRGRRHADGRHRKEALGEHRDGGGHHGRRMGAARWPDAGRDRRAAGLLAAAGRRRGPDLHAGPLGGSLAVTPPGATKFAHAAAVSCFPCMRRSWTISLLAVLGSSASCLGGLERHPLPGAGGSGGGPPATPDAGTEADSSVPPDAGTGADSSVPPAPDAAPDTGPPPVVLVEQACGIIGSGGVRALAYPQSTAPFAVAYGSGQVAFYGPNQWVWRGTVAAHLAPIAAMVASADGSVLATSAGKEIKIWKTADRSLLRTLASPGLRVVGRLAFSPDGTKLVSGSLGPTQTNLWNVDDGSLVWSQSESTVANAAFFAPDGQSVVVGADTLIRRAVSDGALLQSIPLGRRPYQPSPDGTTLLTWSSSAGLSLLRISDLQPVW